MLARYGPHKVKMGANWWRDTALRVWCAGFVVMKLQYIHRPVLYNDRKFDLRYIVLVRSTDPLEICMHKMFWIRLANKRFIISRQNVGDYETHFTVRGRAHEMCSLSHCVR